MDGQQCKLMLEFNSRKVKLVVPSTTSLDLLREKVAEKLDISGKPLYLEYYDQDFEEWIEVDADYQLPEKLGKLKIKVPTSDTTDGATGNTSEAASSTVDMANLSQTPAADTTEQTGTSPPSDSVTEQPETSTPADDATPTADDNTEEELVFPICSNAPEDDSPTSSGDQNPTGASGAAVATEKIWRGRDKLFVYFMDSVEGDYHLKKGEEPKVEYKCIEDWKCRGEYMNTNTVMAWARIWNFAGFPEIPHFEVTEKKGKADIRVRFSETGGNWSMVGMEAAAVTDKKKPTMMLNLKGHSAELMESLVVHEFGHALGLEHEHQRSDFWSVMEKYIDVEKMQTDPLVNPTKAAEGGAAFGRDWFKKVSKSVKQTVPDGPVQSVSTKPANREEPPYDPTSIMHYWFDIKWIEKTTLQTYANIDKEITVEPDRTYLKGLHKRFKNSTRGGLSKKPSMNDYKTLVAAYGGTFVSSETLDVTLKAETRSTVIQASGPREGVLHVNTHLKAIRNEIWDCRVDWRRLGVELELTSGTLDAIDTDKKNVGDKLGAVLEKWMHTGRATINDMLDALEAPIIARNDLAAQIKGLKGNKRAKVGLPPE